jgi:hypothetical protein
VAEPRMVVERVADRASAISSWSLHEVLAMVNPLKKLMRSLAIVVAAVALMVKFCSLLYRSLEFMAVDPRLGVWGSTSRPRTVTRRVFALFILAVSLKCLAEGRSLAYVVWFNSIAVVGAASAERRPARARARARVVRGRPA